MAVKHTLLQVAHEPGQEQSLIAKINNRLGGLDIYVTNIVEHRVNQSFLETAFRLLRDAWFKDNIHRDPEPNESLSDEQERNGYNTRNRVRYNRQTDDIIAGVQRTICPRCEKDLEIRTTVRNAGE